VTPRNHFSFLPNSTNKDLNLLHDGHVLARFHLYFPQLLLFLSSSLLLTGKPLSVFFLFFSQKDYRRSSVFYRLVSILFSFVRSTNAAPPTFFFFAIFLSSFFLRFIALFVLPDSLYTASYSGLFSVLFFFSFPTCPSDRQSFFFPRFS